MTAAALIAVAFGAAFAAGAGLASADDTPAPVVSSTGGVDSAAQEVGGGSPGGHQTPERPKPAAADADAAPPSIPGFVDDYARLWKAVEAGKTRAASLKGHIAGAHRAARWSAADLVLSVRERNHADFTLAVAQDQYLTAVRTMYINGTTDLDVILGVLGSQPQDVLRNIDAFVYLKGAAGNEAADYGAAMEHATAGDSAAAAAQIRSDADRSHAEALGRELKRILVRLASDEDDLQRLVSAAAPQTVVGKSGCPKAVLEGTVPTGVSIKTLCERAVRNAPSAQAAVAIKWALVRLGAPYACEGVGRLASWRYDCSSYVSRAYAEGAGLATAGDDWAPSTRNMVPWGGAALDRHYAPIPPAEIKPGDLVLYDTCPVGQTCTYRHVAMYLGPLEKGGVPMIAQTNRCGGVAHVAPFPGTDVANYLGARRVVALAGERVSLTISTPQQPGRRDIR
ncbi:MAG: NlpC/P60 protein [Actinomycetota bacterium]|nr:NlpC/P60 protein [Actinomycetota bacterium]